MSDRPAQAAMNGETIICDGCLPWVAPFVPDGANLGALLRRYRAAGVRHVSITVASGAENAAEALGNIGRLRQSLEPLSSWVRPVVESREAIQSAVQAEVLSVGMHFQTATPMLADLDVASVFRDLGVTRALLAYNEANGAADGCHEPRNGGLSQLGRRLIERMNSVGMIVDLSHCGERTTFEAMDLGAERPFFSHSNARALFDHERNITDEQIRRCAARDGYIGINGVGFFLAGEGGDLLSAMADHVIHVASLAGIDRVGLGLDFMELTGSDYRFYRAARQRWPRGYPEPPWRFVAPENIAGLREVLVRRGLSEEEISKIFGLNYLSRIDPCATRTQFTVPDSC